MRLQFVGAERTEICFDNVGPGSATEMFVGGHRTAEPSHFCSRHEVSVQSDDALVGNCLKWCQYTGLVI